MNIKLGDGEVDVAKAADGFEIWIDHEGTGDEGGTVSLHWLAGISADQLRAFGRALIEMAGPVNNQTK